jgi:hypothetical protein
MHAAYLDEAADFSWISPLTAEYSRATAAPTISTLAPERIRPTRSYAVFSYAVFVVLSQNAQEAKDMPFAYRLSVPDRHGAHTLISVSISDAKPEPGSSWRFSETGPLEPALNRVCWVSVLWRQERRVNFGRVRLRSRLWP